MATHADLRPTITHLLFVLYLAHLVGGSTSNSTDSSYPSTDGTIGSRSVWSILGSCALTLLICVWHTIHPDISDFEGNDKPFFALVPWIFITSFFAPELVVSLASTEWCDAHRKVAEFRNQGYEWSMTHSYFADMGGFVYVDENGNSSTIDSRKFLDLCKEKKIANPFITEREIMDRSKSDPVGKAIFTVQLLWFTLQVIVRGWEGLAVTLVELDTVCMAVLALVYLFLWWNKPLRPECPYVFYFSGEKKEYPRGKLSKAWKPRPSYLQRSIARFCCTREAQMVVEEEKALAGTDLALPKPGKLTAMVEGADVHSVLLVSLFVTWTLLGGLHLIAWNFEFPTETEKVLWRVASVVLAASPPVIWCLGSLLAVLFSEHINVIGPVLTISAYISGVVSRALLVGLMLAGLRALPSSAHDVVSWTSYIPHL